MASIVKKAKRGLANCFIGPLFVYMGSPFFLINH